jgi:hypothetical protein
VESRLRLTRPRLPRITERSDYTECEDLERMITHLIKRKVKDEVPFQRAVRAQRRISILFL